MRLPPAFAALAAIILAGPLLAQQRSPWDGLLAPRPTLPPQQQQQPEPPQQRPGGVQSEPLPPPSSAQPRQPQPGGPDIAAPPLQRPDQQKGKGAPAQKGPPQPAEVPPPRPDEQRVPNATAVFSGLDKITGRIFPFDAAIDETVQFGALQVTARACYTRPPTEPQNTIGFVEVDEITLDSKIRRIFNGWMFATSPGLNAVEHAIYDVWLVDCKKSPPEIAKPKS